MTYYDYKVPVILPTILKEDAKIDNEMFAWCKKHCNGNFTTDMVYELNASFSQAIPGFSYYYCFEKEEDALMFALTWK